MISLAYLLKSFCSFSFSRSSCSWKTRQDASHLTIHSENIFSCPFWAIFKGTQLIRHTTLYLTLAYVIPDGPLFTFVCLATSPEGVWHCLLCKGAAKTPKQIPDSFLYATKFLCFYYCPYYIILILSVNICSHNSSILFKYMQYLIEVYIPRN